MHCEEQPAWNAKFLALLRLQNYSMSGGCIRFHIPLRFRKAGRVWCGGARETH